MSRRNTLEIVREYAPDPQRAAKAILLVLEYAAAHGAFDEPLLPAPASETSAAPASEPTVVVRTDLT